MGEDAHGHTGQESVSTTANASWWLLKIHKSGDAEIINFKDASCKVGAGAAPSTEKTSRKETALGKFKTKTTARGTNKERSLSQTEKTQ